MPADKKIRRASPKKAKTAGAVKRKKAVTRSPVHQPENFGYPITLHRDPRVGFRIIAGCRNFTPGDAADHWTENARLPWSGCANPEPVLRGGRCGVCDEHIVRARKMVKLLPLLATRAKRYGWL